MQTSIPLRIWFTVRCTLLQKISYQYNQERIRPAYAEVQSGLGFFLSRMIQATSTGRHLLQHIVTFVLSSTFHRYKNSHQRRWQIPRPKAAWAWVNSANSMLLITKLDLSSLYALCWHYLFNRCIIIKISAKNYVKLPKRGKIPKTSKVQTLQI